MFVRLPLFFTTEADGIIYLYIYICKIITQDHYRYLFIFTVIYLNKYILIQLKCIFVSYLFKSNNQVRTRYLLSSVNDVLCPTVCVSRGIRVSETSKRFARPCKIYFPFYAFNTFPFGFRFSIRI